MLRSEWSQGIGQNHSVTTLQGLNSPQGQQTSSNEGPGGTGKTERLCSSAMSPSSSINADIKYHVCNNKDVFVKSPTFRLRREVCYPSRLSVVYEAFFFLCAQTHKKWKTHQDSPFSHVFSHQKKKLRDFGQSGGSKCPYFVPLFSLLFIIIISRC